MQSNKIWQLFVKFQLTELLPVVERWYFHPMYIYSCNKGKLFVKGDFIISEDLALISHTQKKYLTANMMIIILSYYHHLLQSYIITAISKTSMFCCMEMYVLQEWAKIALYFFPFLKKLFFRNYTLLI